jgi:hypothetical protein
VPARSVRISRAERQHARIVSSDLHTCP